LFLSVKIGGIKSQVMYLYVTNMSQLVLKHRKSIRMVVKHLHPPSSSTGSQYPQVRKIMWAVGWSWPLAWTSAFPRTS